MGRWRHGLHAPGGGQPHSGGGGADSHRGPEQEDGKGGGGCGLRPQGPPSSLSTERGAEARGKHALAGRQAGGWGGSQHSPSDGFRLEPAGPFAELERGGAGSCPVWSVSDGCPAGGVRPRRPTHIGLQAPASGGGTLFFSSMHGHRLTAPRLPRGEEGKKSKANQIQILKQPSILKRVMGMMMTVKITGKWLVGDAAGIIQFLRETPVVKQPMCKGPGE